MQASVAAGAGCTDAGAGRQSATACWAYTFFGPQADEQLARDGIATPELLAVLLAHVPSTDLDQNGSIASTSSDTVTGPVMATNANARRSSSASGSFFYSGTSEVARWSLFLTAISAT
jgi:hypothetical protein